MKIVFQYFDDAEDAKGFQWEGDCIAEATTWEEAHEIVELLKQGNTVPPLTP